MALLHRIAERLCRSCSRAPLSHPGTRCPCPAPLPRRRIYSYFNTTRFDSLTLLSRPSPARVSTSPTALHIILLPIGTGGSRALLAVVSESKVSRHLLSIRMICRRSSPRSGGRSLVPTLNDPQLGRGPRARASAALAHGRARARAWRIASARSTAQGAPALTPNAF